MLVIIHIYAQEIIYKMGVLIIPQNYRWKLERENVHRNNAIEVSNAVNNCSFSEIIYEPSVCEHKDFNGNNFYHFERMNFAWRRSALCLRGENFWNKQLPNTSRMHFRDVTIHVFHFANWLKCFKLYLLFRNNFPVILFQCFCATFFWN